MYLLHIELSMTTFLELGYTKEKDCLKNNKDGLKYIWALPYDAKDLQNKECLIQSNKPECVEAPWSR